MAALALAGRRLPETSGSMSRRDALKTHTYKSMDPTGTTGAVHQAESTSDAVEFSMQAGRTLLVQDVRTSFVPPGQRYKMVGEQHHVVANQQILQREQKRAAQIHGVERLVLKDLHDRTHHHDGSLKTWHPSVIELLSRFPPESQDEIILTDMNIGQMPQHMEILRHIRKVDLANNKIHRLSEGISQIHGLEELILTNNQLVELPRTLNLLSSLRVLSKNCSHVVNTFAERCNVVKVYGLCRRPREQFDGITGSDGTEKYARP